MWGGGQDLGKSALCGEAVCCAREKAVEKLEIDFFTIGAWPMAVGNGKSGGTQDSGLGAEPFGSALSLGLHGQGELPQPSCFVTCIPVRDYLGTTRRVQSFCLL